MVEDAPSGVQAATAAGMRVVVVPSIRDKDAYPKPDPEASAGITSQHLRTPLPLSKSPAPSWEMDRLHVLILHPGTGVLS